jgi:hypothetical protein
MMLNSSKHNLYSSMNQMKYKDLKAIIIPKRLRID